MGISAAGASAGSPSSLGAVPNAVTATDVTLNGGGLLDTSSLTLNPNRGITLTGTGLLDAAGGVNFVVGGIIAGTGNGIIVNSGFGDTGVVVLGGADTFSGTTVISNGTLNVSNTLALQNSTLSYNSGSLTFDGGITAATLGGLSGTNNLNLINAASGAVTLTVGGNNATTAYSGNLFDFSVGSSLIKIGSGTLTLSNANYTGNTTVSNNGTTGTLIIAGGSFGSGSSTITVGTNFNNASISEGLVITNATATAGTVNIGAATNCDFKLDEHCGVGIGHVQFCEPWNGRQQQHGQQSADQHHRDGELGRLY